VVWQADDAATQEVAEELRSTLPYRLHVIHQHEVGIVPAENLALALAVGQIILLIDDDAIAPPGWVARHLSFYSDSTVGAVGGPAISFYSDGTPFPRRAVEPVGKLTWYGKGVGNLYDHIPEWSSRPPQEGSSLVGYNMSLRREAFERFEDRLKPYWQLFELEVCLQVKASGYRVLIDFGNIVEHHPTNLVYAPGRTGDLAVKVYNAAYNHGFVLAKHSGWFLRPCRFFYLLLVGSVGSPGLAASVAAIRRYGHPLRELMILWRTWQHILAGWHAGATTRSSRSLL
jgi:glycosyltransferase involved in cell wall biosynthesis